MKSKSPDGKAFRYVLHVTVIIRVYVLVIRPFALAFFSPDDCAKSLPLASLNPAFAEKAESLRCFHLVLFIIPSNLLPPPLTRYSIQCVDGRLFPNEACFSIFWTSDYCSVPLVRKLSLIKLISD